MSLESTEYREQSTENSAPKTTRANSSLCSLNSLISLISLNSLNSLIARHHSTTTHLLSLTLSQSHMSQGVGYVTSVTRCDKQGVTSLRGAASKYPSSLEN